MYLKIFFFQIKKDFLHALSILLVCYLFKGYLEILSKPTFSLTLIHKSAWDVASENLSTIIIFVFSHYILVDKIRKIYNFFTLINKKVYNFTIWTNLY